MTTNRQRLAHIYAAATGCSRPHALALVDALHNTQQLPPTYASTSLTTALKLLRQHHMSTTTTRPAPAPLAGNVDTRPLRVVLSEDMSTNRMLYERVLQPTYPNAELVWAPSWERTFDAIAQAFDLLITDNCKPGAPAPLPPQATDAHRHTTSGNSCQPLLGLLYRLTSDQRARTLVASAGLHAAAVAEHFPNVPVLSKPLDVALLRQRVHEILTL